MWIFVQNSNTFYIFMFRQFLYIEFIKSSSMNKPLMGNFFEFLISIFLRVIEIG